MGLDVGAGPNWVILDKILLLNSPNSYRLTQINEDRVICEPICFFSSIICIFNIYIIQGEFTKY